MNDKQIIELFESCLEWKENNGGTNQQAAARFPEHQVELLDLLEMADQVNQVNIPGPRPEFKAAARARMLNLISAQEKAKARTVVTKLWPSRQIKHNNKLTRRLSMTWIIVISLLATVLAGGGGVAYASTDALPGDALYPVKNAIQDIELAFANDEKEVGLRLTQLDINIDELEELVEEERLDDVEEGVEEFVENFQAFLQVRSRVNYEDAGTEDSINQRLQTQYQALTNLQEQFQHSDKIQQKLQTAAQLTETGKTYGPNDGGKPEESGEPNGAGPGEPGNKPEDAGNGAGEGQGKPEDAGSGAGEGQGKPEDAGSGTGEGQGQGSGCQMTTEGEVCKPDDIGYVCTETEEGELTCTNEHPEYGYGAYLCEKLGEGEVVCKPEAPREGQFGPAAPGTGPGGTENNKP